MFRASLPVVDAARGRQRPIADAGPDQIGIAAGTGDFERTGSYDPDGDRLTYQ
jgi:hypothetical protein